MTSKLASLAKVVFSAKMAAARSAPAAIVGPLQNIFCRAEATEEEESAENQRHEVILESSDIGESSPEANNSGILSGIVVRAEAMTSARLAASPIDTPHARQELREFQQDYYRRQIATPDQQVDYVEDPDLSVPVGDEYLYLAQ